MKDRKKSRFLPKSLIKNLSVDIKNLMDNNEGRLFSLEIMEDIPIEFRPFIIEGLSAFYEEEIAVFFALLQKEYGKELETPIRRALEKHQMAGIQVNPSVFNRGEFYRAFATRSRHTGQLTIDVAWKGPEELLDIECYFLSYGADGINSTFVISEMLPGDYDRERDSLPDTVEITLPEVVFLLQEAYAFNVRYMTRPGLGRFLFQKYLDMPQTLSPLQQKNLLLKISGQLSPQQLVNSFFHALRYRDRVYIQSLLVEEKFSQPSFVERLEQFINSQTLLIEGQVSESQVREKFASIKAYSISVDGEEVYRSKYSFYLRRKEGRWLIADVHRDVHQTVTGPSDLDAVSMKVLCQVYEVLDIDELLTALDEVENIREAGELPYGIHLRIAKYKDDFERGVFFLTGVLADLVINGDELVVITKDQDSLNVLHEIVIRNNRAVFVTRHEVNALTVYRYLSGQYLSFDDIIAGSGGEKLFGDGMKFLSARYIVRDRERVTTKLEKLRSVRYELPGKCQVFYQYRNGKDPEVDEFVAEYVLGESWVTVSAFGDKEINVVRESFEKDIKDCLEFEGLEVKRDGLFDILTFEVKDQYPHLEEDLKKAYLEKWYQSNLKPLKGLSPAQARESVEGRRLLWEMFKKMSLQKKTRYPRGKRNYLHIREYMRKVDL